MFIIICEKCKSTDVVVMKSMNGVYFECINGHKGELTLDIDDKPVWEDYDSEE